MHAWMQASMDEMRSFIALVPLTLRAFEPNWSRLADWCMIGILAEDRQSDKKDCVCSVVSLKRKQILWIVSVVGLAELPLAWVSCQLDIWLEQQYVWIVKLSYGMVTYWHFIDSELTLDWWLVECYGFALDRGCVRGLDNCPSPRLVGWVDQDWQLIGVWASVLKWIAVGFVENLCWIGVLSLNWHIDIGLTDWYLVDRLVLDWWCIDRFELSSCSGIDIGLSDRWWIGGLVQDCHIMQWLALGWRIDGSVRDWQGSAVV